ncbi:MAG TPA: serine/threonine-protein kinase [Gemmatimonadaceae bacterium]|jgi:serine/threonine-protein kinase|nr:serine/threonine-protein kinase [Gemmatimonadaceae bacterium]
MTVLEMIPTPDPRTLDAVSRPFAEAIGTHYAIKKLIGQGGMGLVYLARDKRLDRLVAIKTLLPQLAADASVRERFLRETRTAGAMAHPNIVPIHGADELAGYAFFVMGFVDGESLAAHVRSEGRLQPHTLAGYLHDVASALAHAHARGIVHRDIKAENILIDRATGRALVTDFGIARLADAQPLTATGQLLGTVYYVSPEQVSGEPIDARSDLYSLGVVGFLALTGRFPFDSDVASAVLVAHVTKPAPRVASINPNLPAVPAPLAAIIDRLLAKKPAERFGTAEELLTALDGVLEQLDPANTATVRSALVSDSEAHAVWRRAAELQAMTGIQPRPAAIPRPRNSTKDRVRASGFRVDEIRSAASVAGIDTQYIDHALIEHGLTGKSVVAVPAVAPSVPRSWWAGVPLKLTREVVVPGELEPREFERVLNTVREATGRMGTAPAKTREIYWRSSTIQISVVPNNGVSTVRMTRDTHRLARRTIGFVFAGGAIAGPAIAAIVDSLMYLPGPDWAVMSHQAIDAICIGLGFGVALTALPIGRMVLRRLMHRAEAAATALTDTVAEKVRESLDR